MFENIRGLMGMNRPMQNSEEEEILNIFADIDIDFTISKNGSLSRNPKDNIKNKFLMESYSKASRLVTK